MVRKIGKYIVGDTLGAGGFSKVKLGTHEDTKQRVALKLLKKDALNMNSSTRKQVEREITALSRVKHPNVINLREVQWDAVYEKKDGQKIPIILVVLELATGGELFEFLSHTGFFQEDYARTYFHQLVGALYHCHSQSIVHRDLKPENLLLDDQFMLKVADFGFARLFSPSNKIMYTECGTPSYMAPEVTGNQGAGYDATAADVWSIGVILFIMLAGFPPFQRPNMSDWWFHKLATHKIDLFWKAHLRSATFTPKAQDLLNRMLEVDGSKRISLKDVMNHPWFSGPTVPHGKLTSEFCSRKQQIDLNKAKARAERKQRQHQGGALEDATMRSLGSEDRSDSDELPLCPPSYSLALFPDPSESVAGESKAPEIHKLASSSGFDDDDDSFGGAPTGYRMTSLKDDDFGGQDNNNVQCTESVWDENETFGGYSFLSNLDASTLYQRTLSLLASIRASIAEKQSQYKVKAELLTSEGTVSFYVQIFKHPQLEDTHVVYFKRRKGSSMQFHNTFLDSRGQLADIIYIPPVVEEQKAQDS